MRGENIIRNPEATIPRSAMLPKKEVSVCIQKISNSSSSRSLDSSQIAQPLSTVAGVTARVGVAHTARPTLRVADDAAAVRGPQHWAVHGASLVVQRSAVLVCLADSER